MSDDALFDHYEHEVRSLIHSASRKVAVALSSIDDETKCRANLETANEDVTDANGVIESMVLEAKTTHSEKRVRLEARITTTKVELDRIKAEIKRVKKMQSNADRAELFGEGDEEAGGLSDKARFVESTEKKLNRGSERIRESIRVANETEGIGASILETLSTQRQTMLRARDNVGLMDDDMTRSRGLLSTMSRRVMVHKLVIYATVAVFLAALFLIIVFRLTKKRE